MTTPKIEARKFILRQSGAEALDNARKARSEGRDQLAAHFAAMAKIHARSLRRLNERHG